MAQCLTNPTRNHEVAGLVPGLAGWVKDTVRQAVVQVTDVTQVWCLYRNQPIYRKKKKKKKKPLDLGEQICSCQEEGGGSGVEILVLSLA